MIIKVITCFLLLIFSYISSAEIKGIKKANIYEFENFADIYCNEKKMVIRIIKSFQNPENKTISPKLAEVIHLPIGEKYTIENIEINSSANGLHVKIGSFCDFIDYTEPEHDMIQAKSFIYYITPQFKFERKVASNIYPYWELRHPPKEEREYISNIFKNKRQYLEKKFLLNNGIAHDVMLRSITEGMRLHVLSEYNKPDYRENLGIIGLTVDYIRNFSKRKIPSNKTLLLSEILTYWDINTQSDAIWEKAWTCFQEEFDGDKHYLYKLWVLWALNSDYITPEEFSRVVDYNQEIVRDMLKEKEWKQNYTDLYTKLEFFY